jgi:hypothetical protein
MISRRFLSLVTGCLAVTLFACRANEGVAPRGSWVVPTRDDGEEWSGRLPGWRRPDSGIRTQSANGQLLVCSRRQAVEGSAVIGPSGGELIVGENRLIVPPGALIEPTLITGTVPADTIASIHFEPQGLQFRKPAGLVINARGCGPVSDEPSVLYIDDDGNVLERINAVYSNWWRTVAAPINHFSVYAIGV